MRPTPKTITAILDELMIEDQKLNMKFFGITETNIRITSGKVPTILDAHRAANSDGGGLPVLNYTRDGINIVISITDDEERPDLFPAEVLRVMEFVPQEFDDVEVYAERASDTCSVRRVKFDVWNAANKCIFYGGLGFASLGQ